jgi:hypothetical protein
MRAKISPNPSSAKKIMIFRERHIIASIKHHPHDLRSRRFVRSPSSSTLACSTFVLGEHSPLGSGVNDAFIARTILSTSFFQEVRLCASTVCRTHRLAGLESGFEVRLVSTGENTVVSCAHNVYTQTVNFVFLMAP